MGYRRLVHDYGTHQRKEFTAGSANNRLMPAKQHRFYFVILLILLAGWVWLFFNLSFTGHSFTICLFKKLTGLPCPSCGSTRAITILFRGGLLQSLYINPVGLVMLVVSMTTSIWLTLDLLMSRSALYRFYLRCENYLQAHPTALFLFLGMISINWLWNIYKGL